MSLPDALYPTAAHARAAEVAAAFFAEQVETEAIVLAGECGRGAGQPTDPVEQIVLVPPDVLARQGERLFRCWVDLHETETAFKELRESAPGADLIIEFSACCYTPAWVDWHLGNEMLELKVGREIAYATPLWDRRGQIGRLRTEWLPYYNNDLQKERLARVHPACREHLTPLTGDLRSSPAVFDPLLRGVRRFMQALMIARRKYPLSYSGLLYEQIVGILGMEALYDELIHLFTLDSRVAYSLAARAARLLELLDLYANPDAF
jgi:hypothetical protein